MLNSQVRGRGSSRRRAGTAAPTEPRFRRQLDGVLQHFERVVARRERALRAAARRRQEAARGQADLPATDLMSAASEYRGASGYTHDRLRAHGLRQRGRGLPPRDRHPAPRPRLRLPHRRRLSEAPPHGDTSPAPLQLILTPPTPFGRKSRRPRAPRALLWTVRLPPDVTSATGSRDAGYFILFLRTRLALPVVSSRRSARWYLH